MPDLPPNESPLSPLEPDVADGTLQEEIERLSQVMLYGRWLLVGILWLTVGTLSLWGLRYPISLLLDYFTWTAVRYGLAFHRLPAIGLATCIGLTVAVLLRHSRTLLFGLSPRDRQRLAQQVQRIRLQGSRHPLWKFVCRPKSTGSPKVNRP